MAIKGKGKARSRRVIAAPPRPALVVRKPALWRRQWVRVVAGLLVLGAIGFGIFSILHSRGAKARKSREVLAVQEYVNLVRDALPKDRSAVPPDLVVIFPSVSDDLPKIGTDIKGSAASKRGSDITSEATASVDAFDAIDITATIPDEFSNIQDELTDAHYLMTQAMTIYERVGHLVQIAAGPIDKAKLEAVIEQAQELSQQAGNLFDTGYAKVVHLAKDLGISITVPPAPTETNPPSSPTPAPTATTEPTPTATEPSASPSA
jgi:hypothetical protein